MRGEALVTLVLLSVSLSGCLSDDASTPDPDPTDETVLIDPTTGATRVLVARNATFDLEERYEWGEDTTGTFEAGQHWDQNGEFQAIAGADHEGMHRYDISDHIPLNIPVVIEGEVNADLAEGDIDFWLNINDDDVWSTSFEAPRGGYTYWRYHVLRTTPDPVEVVVFYDELEPVQSFEYALKVSAYADRQVVPGFTGVTVPVDQDTHELVFEPEEGRNIDFVLLDPDDTMHRLSAQEGRANISIGPDSARGDWIVMSLDDETGFAAIIVEAHAPDEADDHRADATYGFARTERTRTSPVTFGDLTAGDIDFEVPENPLRVGLNIIINDMTHGVDVSLEGPNGNVFAVAFADDTPFMSIGPDNAMGFGFGSNFADPDIIAGAYSGHFEGDPNGAGQIQGYWVTFVR